MNFISISVIALAISLGMAEKVSHSGHHISSDSVKEKTEGKIKARKDKSRGEKSGKNSRSDSASGKSRNEPSFPRKQYRNMENCHEERSDSRGRHFKERNPNFQDRFFNSNHGDQSTHNSNRRLVSIPNRRRLQTAQNMDQYNASLNSENSTATSNSNSSGNTNSPTIPSSFLPPGMYFDPQTPSELNKQFKSFNESPPPVPAVSSPPKKKSTSAQSKGKFATSSALFFSY
jgi:hypothetical protein